MSIWNKILVGLIAVASLGFFYLAARTLKTHTYWSGKAAAAEARIEQLKAANKQLEPGIRQLRVDLYKLLVDRRRAWFNCPARVTRLDRADGTAEITVTIDKASPDRIAQKNVFYAFDDTPVQQKGRYLGEFVVTSVADKQVALAPAVKLNSREINNLATAKGTWTLYEVMPQDSHDIFADPMFAGLSDAEKKAILPADSVAQYLKDGQPAAKDDPKQSVVNGKYVRPLRDYDDPVPRRPGEGDPPDRRDRRGGAGQETGQEAVALAQTQVDACTRDIAAAKDELAGMTAQRKLVADYLAKFQKALDEVRAAMKKTLQDNQAKAGQIAKLQLEAAERIDRRGHGPVRRGEAVAGGHLRSRLLPPGAAAGALFLRPAQRRGDADRDQRRRLADRRVDSARDAVGRRLARGEHGRPRRPARLRPRRNAGHAHASIALVAVSYRRVCPFAHGLHAYSLQHDRAFLFWTRRRGNLRIPKSFYGCTW